VSQLETTNRPSHETETFEMNDSEKVLEISDAKDPESTTTLPTDEQKGTNENLAVNLNCKA